MSDLFKHGGALFSPCRKYRYMLWRLWNTDLPMVLFIGLNPSKADEHENDRTISKVMKFAQSWGYGGVYMMNLFAWIDKNPDALLKCEDPVGEENDRRLFEVAQSCEWRVIAAWGASAQSKERAKHVGKMFPQLFALEINKDGSPKHPLYVKGITKPIPYKSDAL